jgi:hypothetical protein
VSLERESENGETPTCSGKWGKSKAFGKETEIRESVKRRREGKGMKMRVCVNYFV